MTWKPIVVGVDASPEAAGAAALASRIAAAARTSCHLVHAARDLWGSLQPDEGGQELQRAVIDAARIRVAAQLKDVVPRELVHTLSIRIGRTATVLGDAVTALGAELVVVGGKHHSTFGRWLGGSTSLSVVRTTHVPLLVTVGSPLAIRRVLVAVDASEAARPTLQAAERVATTFGAELRSLSVVEPLPVMPEVTPPYDTAGYYALAEQQLERDAWSHIRTPGVERLIRYGQPLEVIAREATDFRADLLVVGSHGRGWAERMLVGSVTERLLNQLPTSVLVVPTAIAAVAETKERVGAQAAQPVAAIA